MRKLMTHASIRFVLGFWFIVLFFIFGNIPAVKADDTQTVEGEWEIQSSWDGMDIGSRYAITHKDDGYHVIEATAGSQSENSGLVYYGSPTQITATKTLSYDDLLRMFSKEISGNSASASAVRTALPQLADKVTIKHRITVFPDGHSAEHAEDGILIFFDTNGQMTRYEITPFAHILTLARVLPENSKVENRGDHAYQADCGKVDPNRTTPIMTDLCPGNLVAMTYFCGGGTGCPYVCCPKGLPYLNHCDCKCYATADFDCHSYSKAQEQPKQ